MSKILFLNDKSVIVDIVDELHYVAINPTTGVKYLCGGEDKKNAKGIIGSNGNILNLASAVFAPDDRDVAYVRGVTEVPDYVEALKYTWNKDDGFALYDGTVSRTASELTADVSDNQSAINDLADAVADIIGA